MLNSLFPFSISLKSYFQANPDRTIWCFLFCWTGFNIIQGSLLELHADEAYYWVYSRFLAWGYYDHPPMVAVFIRLGYALFQNEFGLRLLTIISSSVTIWVLWLIVKRYHAKPVLFILVVPALFIFHIYGFITTPDAPLLLFTTLFYYLFSKYIAEDNWLIAGTTGLVTACLLYSKYHALLLLLLTLAANLQLLRRPSFWLIIVLAGLLYVPHILWQFQHHYPSLSYHLYERSSKRFDISRTLLFVPGQLLMAGPLVGWYLFYGAFTVKAPDRFVRTLFINAIGTLIFFLLCTIKGSVQPQWTLIAYVPVIILALVRFEQIGMRVWSVRLCTVNVVLIVAVRIALISNVPFVDNFHQLKSLFGLKTWTQEIRAHIGNAYIISTDGFYNPSKYNFYTGSLKAFAYDSRYYRRTQYDIWPIEDSLQHKRAFYLTDEPVAGMTTDSMQTDMGMQYGSWVNDVRTFQKISIDPGVFKLKCKPGQDITVDLTLTNPSLYPVNFRNDKGESPVVMEACFSQGDTVNITRNAGTAFNRIQLKALQTVPYRFTFIAPLKRGQYELLFSIRTEPFPGGHNSRVVSAEVE